MWLSLVYINIDTYTYIYIPKIQTYTTSTYINIHYHTRSFIHTHIDSCRHTYIDSCIQAHSYNYCSYTFFHTINREYHLFIHIHTCIHDDVGIYKGWHSNIALLRMLEFPQQQAILHVFKFKCSIQWLQHTCFLDLIHIGYAWLCVTLFHANKNENVHSSSPVRVFYHLNQVGSNKFWWDKF